MAITTANSTTSLADVLDRILDKGIVIDAWVSVSLVGIELLTVQARVVVASIDTYLKYAEAIGLLTQPKPEQIAATKQLASPQAVTADRLIKSRERTAAA